MVLARKQTRKDVQDRKENQHIDTNSLTIRPDRFRHVVEEVCQIVDEYFIFFRRKLTGPFNNL